MAKKIPLYFTAFLEGAALMALELISSRILAVGFGSTLKVWAVLLTMTLLGLALGYYFGGKFSAKPELRIKLLLGLSLFSSVFLLLYPGLGSGVVDLFDGLGLITGTFLASLVLVFVPLCVFGMFSPLLIDLLNENKTEKSGSTAGLVYGISTLGGIVATFLFGLYILPYFGIRVSSFILSGIFAVVLVQLLLIRKA